MEAAPVRIEWDGLLFEWDEGKARSNQQKHGVTFREAAAVFGDPRARIAFDEAHSGDEERFFILGYSDSRRLLAATYVEREGRIRIISARAATARERKDYERDRRPGT
jgi:uncharacterized DUF497 family protein